MRMDFFFFLFSASQFFYLHNSDVSFYVTPKLVLSAIINVVFESLRVVRSALISISE